MSSHVLQTSHNLPTHTTFIDLACKHSQVSAIDLSNPNPNPNPKLHVLVENVLAENPVENILNTQCIGNLSSLEDLGIVPGAH